MKTSTKLFFLLFPLYIGCGMGIQSDDLEAEEKAATSTTIMDDNSKESLDTALAEKKGINHEIRNIKKVTKDVVIPEPKLAIGNKNSDEQTNASTNKDAIEVLTNKNEADIPINNYDILESVLKTSSKTSTSSVKAFSKEEIEAMTKALAEKTITAKTSTDKIIFLDAIKDVTSKKPTTTVKEFSKSEIEHITNVLSSRKATIESNNSKSNAVTDNTIVAPIKKETSSTKELTITTKNEPNNNSTDKNRTSKSNSNKTNSTVTLANATTPIIKIESIKNDSSISTTAPANNSDKKATNKFETNKATSAIAVTNVAVSTKKVANSKSDLSTTNNTTAIANNNNKKSTGTVSTTVAATNLTTTEKKIANSKSDSSISNNATASSSSTDEKTNSKSNSNKVSTAVVVTNASVKKATNSKSDSSISNNTASTTNNDDKKSTRTYETNSASKTTVAPVKKTTNPAVNLSKNATADATTSSKDKKIVITDNSKKAEASKTEKILQSMPSSQMNTKEVKPFSQKEVDAMANALAKQKNTETNVPNRRTEEAQNRIGTDDLRISILKQDNEYKTNKSHTIVVELSNNENKSVGFKFEALLPAKWTILSMNEVTSLDALQKKLILISFNIPMDFPAGKAKGLVLVKNENGQTLVAKDLVFTVEQNFDLEVYNIFTTTKLQAGETINAKYEIKNKGNSEQEVTLSSKSKINGDLKIKIAPNSSVVVETNQITDPKLYDFITVGNYLDVVCTASGKTYKAFGSTEVFPSKLKKQDAFFRYPMRLSLNYNSNTFQDVTYAALSGELVGDGFLDLKKKNYLNFIIRAPQQKNLRTFGITDQYSLIYTYNNNTTLYLGDHAYYINRLGFDSRFGMGFRLDQRIDQWTLSAFFSKPRLYSFNAEALFGLKSVYRFSKSALLGLAIESSKGTIAGANNNIEANPDEKGQIATANFELNGKNTFINTESSLSFTNQNTDHAQFINLIQKFQNLTYTGSFTYSGKNYFGIIRNSIEYSNSLFYKFRKFDFVAGQTLSKVNKRLNPLFFAAEPYFENYYGRIGYRFSPRNYLNVRVDKRTREDQLEPKSYFYKEAGIEYRYFYSGNKFSIGFTGRIAETQNLLSDDVQARTTYAHNLDASYRFSNHFAFRGAINHNYNNRYSASSFNNNYYTYNLGLDYSFNKNIRFNGTYNSGFSPEENYLKRDFINAMLMVTIAKNHLFEFRVNYFENPGFNNRKEILGFATYSYSFGAPIKRILELGGVNGFIDVTDKSIDVKGIKIIAVGKSVVTNSKGNFELNNLPLGKNYILLDESTLPIGVIPLIKTPFQAIIEKDKKVDLTIKLVRSATVKGILGFSDAAKSSTTNLEGYLKIENEDFKYFVESNAQGVFNFQNITPGTYKLTLIRTKGDVFFELEKEIQFTVAEGEKSTIKVGVKGKERKIQFKNKTFKVGG